MGALKVRLYTDAGARGNPGPSAYAAIICADDGKVMKQVARYIGEATNNEAEYTALVAGLEEALRLGADEVEVTSDSELMVRQVNGQYRMKAENLRPLLEEAQRLMARFKSASISHARREHPMITRADALVNRELDDMELARRVKG